MAIRSDSASAGTKPCRIPMMISGNFMIHPRKGIESAKNEIFDSAPTSADGKDQKMMPTVITPNMANRLTILSAHCIPNTFQISSSGLAPMKRGAMRMGRWCACVWYAASASACVVNSTKAAGSGLPWPAQTFRFSFRMRGASIFRRLRVHLMVSTRRKKLATGRWCGRSLARIHCAATEPLTSGRPAGASGCWSEELSGSTSSVGGTSFSGSTEVEGVIFSASKDDSMPSSVSPLEDDAACSISSEEDCVPLPAWSEGRGVAFSTSSCAVVLDFPVDPSEDPRGDVLSDPVASSLAAFNSFSLRLFAILISRISALSSRSAV